MPKLTYIKFRPNLQAGTPLITILRLKFVWELTMRRRLSSEDFMTFYDALWERGPTVKYRNSDGWISFLYRK